jgi:hypothetical protein
LSYGDFKALGRAYRIFPLKFRDDHPGLASFVQRVYFHPEPATLARGRDDPEVLNIRGGFHPMTRISRAIPARRQLGIDKCLDIRGALDVTER